jgi:hypothetical protein
MAAITMNTTPITGSGSSCKTREFDPNFKYCSFCKGDQNRKDNLCFSHWLKDPKTGRTTCPFLLSTVCGICFEYGHTTNRCTNRFKLQELQFAAMCLNGEDLNAKAALIEYEEEVMRRECVKLYLSLDKSCAFCANYKDNFFGNLTDNLYAGFIYNLMTIYAENSKRNYKMDKIRLHTFHTPDFDLVKKSIDPIKWDDFLSESYNWLFKILMSCWKTFS